MSKLEKSMQQMKDAKVPTEEYAELQKACEQAEQKLNSYIATEDRMKATGQSQNSQAWKNLQYNIDEARKTLKAYQADMENMRNDGTAFKGQDTSGMEQKYEALKGRMQELRAAYAEAGNAARSSGSSSTSSFANVERACTRVIAATRRLSSLMVSSFRRVYSAVSRVATSVGGIGVKILGMVNPMRLLKSSADSCSTSVGKFANRMMRMAKTAFVFSVFRSGFNNLRKYLTSMLMTNKQFANSMAQIKGNLLTAFQPIYSACLPAINALASALAVVTGYLAQFISLLFGKSIKASQAAAKTQWDQVQAYNETAKAAKKAKQAKKELSDVDELHVINDKDGNDSSGGGGGSVEPNFNTDIVDGEGALELVNMLKKAWADADFTEIGILIGNKLNEALQKIPWDDIKTAAGKIGKSIATFINGAVSVKELWDTIGTTIGQGLNTATSMANSFVSNLNWKDLGDSIGRAINSLINTVDWNTLATTFSNCYNGVFAAIEGIVDQIKWDETGSKLGKAFNKLLKSFKWTENAKVVSKGIKKIGKLITNFCSNVDWKATGKEIGKSFTSLLKAFTSKDFTKGATSLVNALVKSIAGMIDGVKWDDIGTSLGSAVNRLLKETDWKTLFSGAAKLVNGVVSSIISFCKSTDWSKIGSTIADSINTFIKDTDFTKMFTGISHIVVSIITTLATMIRETNWREVGKAITDALDGIDWKGIGDSLYSLIEACVYGLNDLLLHLGYWVVEKIVEGIGSYGGKIWDKVSECFTSDYYEWDNIKKRFQDSWDDIVNFFDPRPDKMKEKGKDAGKNAIKGFDEGVNDEKTHSHITQTFKDTADEEMIGTTKKELDIHSPSRKFYQIGVYALQGLINGAKSLFSSLGGTFKTAVSDFVKAPFNNINDWFSTKFTSASSKLKNAFSLGSIKSHFRDVKDGIKSIFENIPDWFKSKFSVAWENVKKVFSSGGKVFTGIKEGIDKTFKSVVNALIGGINTIIAKPFNAINGMLNKIHDVDVFGLGKPFASLWSRNPLSVPQIPKLATGTVVPANYGDFLAVLGDNKREPEVVSPLSTLRQAVKEALEENGGSNAGEINIDLHLDLDGATVYRKMFKVNAENKKAGRTAFATT